MSKRNSKLEDLRRRWEADEFGLDAHGVYGVEESVEEASAHLAMYDERRPEQWEPSRKNMYGEDISIYEDQQDGMIGPDLGPPDRNRPQTANNDASKVFERDRRLGYKTCCVCNMPRRNNPCDACYRMVRGAGEWVDVPGTINKEGVYFCAMCDGPAAHTICGECVAAVLGG